jgi:hypothetical protein
MTLTWAQRREELLGDCIVSPDIFNPMIDRLAAFVVPYQQALETEAVQRNMHLYLQGLLSHLPSKNAEDIATLVNVERLVIQAFIGTGSCTSIVRVIPSPENQVKSSCFTTE